MTPSEVDINAVLRETARIAGSLIGNLLIELAATSAALAATQGAQGAPDGQETAAAGRNGATVP